MRVFVEPARLQVGELVLTGDEHFYLARSRRARVGDAVEVVDGEGRVGAGVIAAMSDDRTVVVVATAAAVLAKPPHVRALLPLLKGERMDYALEKLVEVGVDTVIVWPAARSVVKLDRDRREARAAKFTSALQAAARQSGRAAVPAVVLVDDLAAAIAAVPADGARFVLDPTTDAALEVATDVVDVAFCSGPEGGLAPAELDRLAAAGFVSVGLGPRVLRAETAPVVAVSIVRALTRS